MTENITSMKQNTGAIHNTDPVFYWIGLAIAAFILLPSFALDYGLFDSTSDEFYEAMGWSQPSIAWLWFVLPLGLLVRGWGVPKRSQVIRHYVDIGYSLASMGVILLSSWLTYQGLGYATIPLFIVFIAVMTLAFARLEYLGGDYFVISALITIVLLIAAFIIFPSIAIFIPMFQNSSGQWVAWQFWDIL